MKYIVLLKVHVSLVYLKYLLYIELQPLICEITGKF